MVLDGRSIIDKKMVVFDEDTLIDTDSQIQPNGVDLRLNHLYEVSGTAEVPHDGKVRHDFQFRKIEPKDNWWSVRAQPGLLIYADFLESVSVPGGWCATLITRSSLVRSGIDVVSGLWDSGFTGQLGCCLRINNNIKLEWGSKICQIMFWQAKFNGHLYDGRYQNTNSQTAISS